jgi:hypothetical protein
MVVGMFGLHQLRQLYARFSNRFPRKLCGHISDEISIHIFAQLVEIDCAQAMRLFFENINMGIG